MAVQVPSIARNVHYVSYGSPGGEFTSQHRAAIITDVLPDGRCSLCVLNPTGFFFNVAVEHDEESFRPGTWHWPEFVPAT